MTFNDRLQCIVIIYVTFPIFLDNFLITADTGDLDIGVRFHGWTKSWIVFRET